jgi:hypothetical protein
MPRRVDRLFARDLLLGNDGDLGVLDAEVSPGIVLGLGIYDPAVVDEES